MSIKKLSKEYARYLTVQDLILLDSHPRYIIALEILLINMSMLKKLKRTDEIFVNISKKHKIFKQFYLLANFGFTTKKINILLDIILDKIKKFLIKKKFQIPKKYGNSDNCFYCGGYEKKIIKKRYDILNLSLQKEKLDDIYILICLLRYECIVSRFQQWSMPLTWYKYLYENHNARYEGFSSPFNSQLKLLDDSTFYSSLFYDTDKYFGSIGSIFDINLKQIENLTTTCVLVPPYVNEIINDTNKLVLKWSKKNKNINFILLLPDMPTGILMPKSYKNILTSPYLFYKNKLKEKEWYYENLTMVDKVVKFQYGIFLNIFIFGDKKNKKGFDNAFINTLKDIKQKKNTQTHHKKNLDREYARFLLSQKMVKLYKNKQWCFVLSEFISIMANMYHACDNYPVFLNLPSDHYIYKKLEIDMKCKKLKNIKKNIKIIQKSIDVFLSKKKHNPVKKFGRTLLSNVSLFYCDTFEITLNKTRAIQILKSLNVCRRLHNKINNNIENEDIENEDIENEDIKLILILLLRYQTIIPLENEYSSNFDLYKKIHKKYNINLEGFSSPLNSQTMMISDSTKYCSLFYDTDKYFCSLGNIFNLNIKKIYNKNKNDNTVITLFPPFIPHILVKTTELINNWLKLIPKLILFVIFPNWDNYPLIYKIHMHKFLKYSKLYDKKNIVIENTLALNLTEIKPTIDHWFFVLDNYSHDKYNMF
jgi:hypothetical protein